jgi:hypothetical protein
MLWFLLYAATCSAASAASAVSIEFGPGVSNFVRPRITDLLQALAIKDNRALHISAGLSADLGLSVEGFSIHVKHNDSGIVVANVGSDTALGLSYGLYALLSELGFGFLHPMYVVMPNAEVDLDLLVAMASLERRPKLGIRGSHVHAEHPNELCNMLNGFAADGSFSSRDEWQVLLSEWAQYLQWLLAQGQNTVEWSLLSAKAFEQFDMSQERQYRLSELVRMAKAANLTVGIDATFTQTQEHGFRLWTTSANTSLTEDEDWAEIQLKVDWLLACNFDHINSELGTSELTEGSNVTRLMVMLNRTSRYLESKGKGFMVENHISGGQTVPLPDPLHPGQDLNFNWLTYYLDAHITSRPHTVQVRWTNGTILRRNSFFLLDRFILDSSFCKIYSLEDPAPTYSVKNFTATLAFINLMRSVNRSVVWYPETAYWCNYDASVPLFLAPIYSLSRIADLRNIMQDAQRAGASDAGTAIRGATSKTMRQLDGQILFESGWQWGNWLQNCAAAASQWEEVRGPHDGGELQISGQDDTERGRRRVFQGTDSNGTLVALGIAISRVLAPLFKQQGAHQTIGGGSGDVSSTDDLSQLLVQIAQHQHTILIEGSTAAGPADKNSLAMATGIAYMQGFDAMADLFQLLGPSCLNISNTSHYIPPITLGGIEQGIDLSHLSSQPDRLPLWQLMRRDAKALSFYTAKVQPLLQYMKKTFVDDANTFSAVINKALAGEISSTSARRNLLEGLGRSMKLLAYRATQVDAVYAYAAKCPAPPSLLAPSFCDAQLNTSRQALAAALQLVPQEEAHYGLFANGSSRLWAYQDGVNPTAYGFGHLFQVHKLYYWQRDQQIVEQRQLSPCFANIRNPMNIYLGDGTSLETQRLLDLIVDVLARIPELSNITDCLTQLPQPPFGI